MNDDPLRTRTTRTDTTPPTLKNSIWWIIFVHSLRMAEVDSKTESQADEKAIASTVKENKTAWIPKDWISLLTEQNEEKCAFKETEHDWFLSNKEEDPRVEAYRHQGISFPLPKPEEIEEELQLFLSRHKQSARIESKEEEKGILFTHFPHPRLAYIFDPFLAQMRKNLSPSKRWNYRALDM